jgi:hypothetical protein
MSFPAPTEDERRFFGKMKVVDGCWEWQAAKDKDGYGAFTYQGKTWRAHRWSYCHFIKDLGDNLFILHSCDNPKCVNPSHLSLGTHQDNEDDKTNKGRRPSQAGEINSQSVLTANDVLAIKEILRRHHDKRGIVKFIADWFDVTPQCVSNIKCGKAWSEV